MRPPPPIAAFVGSNVNSVSPVPRGASEKHDGDITDELCWRCFWCLAAGRAVGRSNLEYT